MYKITFKDGNYTGEYLTVGFANGIGYTDSGWLAEKFEEKGLTVEKTEKTKSQSQQEKK